GSSCRPLAAGTTRHEPVATGTTTLPRESSTRNGPEAETTAGPGAGAAEGGTAGLPAAAGLAPTAGLAPAASGGLGGSAGGCGDAPVLIATRTRAGSLAAGARAGSIPP